MATSTFSSQPTTPKSLSVATIIIYIAFLQSLIYVFWRHGLRHWLAWLPLQSLCILRIVGSGIQLHEDATHSSGKTAVLLNSIGLAPLLLASLGILHESRRARNPAIRNSIEWACVIQYHFITVAAIVLVIIGVIGLEGSQPKQSDRTLLKIGVVIIFMCWLVLVAWTVLSFRPTQFDSRAPAYRDGTVLLYGIVVALPFVGLREIDAVLGDFITSKSFLTSLAIKICLSVAPEMIATFIFVNVGLQSRNIRENITAKA